MATISGFILPLMAMAAMSEIAAMLGGEDENGLGLICGLCAAGCMLNGIRNIFGALM